MQTILMVMDAVLREILSNILIVQGLVFHPKIHEQQCEETVDGWEVNFEMMETQQTTMVVLVLDLQN